MAQTSRLGWFLFLLDKGAALAYSTIFDSKRVFQLTFSEVICLKNGHINFTSNRSLDFT